MKRISPRTLLLPVAVCLLSLSFSPAGLAQNKAAAKKQPQADKTLSSKGAAPVVTVAPKTDAVGAAASFLSQLEREIIDEMNLARTQPQTYAAFIEEFKKYYRGNQLTLPGMKQALVTFEGTAAVDEAVNFLRAARPLPAMKITRGTCLAAKDHARDLALKGITGHRGSDGSSPNARLERYGRWEGVVGENIVYDIRTAREIVIGLIIDDGTSNRGHRRNIFNPQHQVAGVSVTDSQTHGAKGVITYVGGYTDSAAAPRR